MKWPPPSVVSVMVPWASSVYPVTTMPAAAQACR